ncbi:thioredoxin family protein [Natrinema sp. SYSU A 869]|uniref:thioredoxin family protein n=1 Tax=Natrinema sp. SYSU A 869 TaxID=2871694 RepID=UPI001CA417A3|nr:thioredoxin family protein [Natrinema sp. SYSU A 869]
MSDTGDGERQRIREQKKRELRERLENGSVSDTSDVGGQASSPDEPIDIEGSDHFDEVINDHDVVLVDCYADWCGPCQILEPTIETLAAETDAAVATVDVDRHQRLAQQLGARGVPTLVLYADGEPVERMVGAQDCATLERLVEQYA